MNIDIDIKQGGLIAAVFLRERKVRATQSTALPNIEDFRKGIVGQQKITAIISYGKGENVG